MWVKKAFIETIEEEIMPINTTDFTGIQNDICELRHYHDSKDDYWVADWEGWCELGGRGTSPQNRGDLNKPGLVFEYDNKPTPEQVQNSIRDFLSNHESANNLTKKAAEEDSSLNRLTIEMELGNASMGDNPEEISTILAKLAPEITEAIFSGMPDEGIVMDTNGNKIGQWRVE